MTRIDGHRYRPRRDAWDTLAGHPWAEAGPALEYRPPRDEGKQGVIVDAE